MTTVLYTSVCTGVWNIYKFALPSFVFTVSYIRADGKIEIKYR